MLHHLFLKCPVRYLLVRSASCIDPRIMAKDPEKSKKKMKQVLMQLVEKKQLPEKNGDDVQKEFSAFLEEIVKKYRSSFEYFDHRGQGLDKFFIQYFQDEQYSNLWEVIKMLLILSHGQAAVERGFSVNKVIEVENLKEELYISQRIIYDTIKCAGSMFDVPITKEMKQSVSSARSKYMIYLDEQKKLKESEASSRKRKVLLEDIEYFNKKKAHLENDILHLENEIDEILEKADANRDIKLFMKSSELRKNVKEKKVDMTEIQAKIDESKKELKKKSMILIFCTILMYIFTIVEWNY